MILNIPQSVRSIQRIQEITRVLARHGFGHILDRLNLGRYLPFHHVFLRPVAEEERSTIGKRMASVCQELGPSFVKFAQMLSTRPDLLPPDIIDQLKLLQDRVAPFDAEIARQIIAEDLGASPDECLAGFDPIPFASGSIAQVHNAVDKNGEKLVMKVKRPGIDRVLHLDMHILEGLAQAAERFVPELLLFHPTLIVSEFSRTVIRELDFINEASATARFGEVFADDPTVVIPKVRWDLTGSRVLTLERIQARRITEFIDAHDGQMERQAIARNLAEAFFRQFFELGIFHADPHPGNLLVLPPARIALVDFGSIGVVDDELSGHLAIGLVGLIKKEIDIVIDVLADMGALHDDTNRSLLRRDLAEFVNKYYGLPLKRMEVQTVFKELTSLLRRNDVNLPRDLVLLTKSFVEVSGVALQLDPELNLLEMIGPKVRQMLRDRFTAQRLIKTAGISTWHFLNVMKNLPRQVRDLMRSLSVGQWRLNVQHQNLETLANELDRSSNRLAVSVLIAAIIVGSSLVIRESATRLFNIPLSTFGAIGFIFAGLMGTWLLFAIWRSGKMY
jgi:ubiquinone biosynthesis protein